MKDMEIRLAGTVDDSIVDGDGLRFAIFVQGCPRSCPGCQNPETQDFKGGYLTTTAALLAEIEKNPLLTGVPSAAENPLPSPPLWLNWPGPAMNAVSMSGAIPAIRWNTCSISTILIPMHCLQSWMYWLMATTGKTCGI